MTELTLVTIFFVTQAIPISPLISVLILIIITIYSIRGKNPRTFSLTVLLLILRYLVEDTTLINIYKSIHDGIYLSFSSFIDNSFPSNIVTFLISITIGTAEVKLSKSTYDIFKQFNLLHVVSISGANFTLIKDLFEVVKKYINKNIVNIFVLIIQSYYILLIGVSNLAAFRAYIFTTIGLCSSLSGRPITFINKLLTTVILIICINPNSLLSSSLWLSLGFSILYKSFELKPLSRIFNNDLKKLSVVFMISVLIFNSSNPDFIANLVFGLIYPIIFIGTFAAYILSIFSIHIELGTKFISLLTELIFISLKQLSSNVNTFAQLIIFIAILTSLVKTSLSRKSYEYSKFAQ